MSVPAQDLRTIPAPVRELGSGPPFPEGGGPSAPTSGEPDWRSLFERERRRAEEWRRGEIDWRAKARFWRRQFEIGRDKLAAARAEVREVRRAAREALSLRAEVERLKRLLAAAGVDAVVLPFTRTRIREPGAFDGEGFEPDVMPGLDTGKTVVGACLVDEVPGSLRRRAEHHLRIAARHPQDAVLAVPVG